MPFDPVTILTSGLLSGVVGWVTATAKAGRDERGKQIAAARRAVQVATQPLRVQVARHDRGIGAPRSPDQHHLDDVVWAAKVLRATSGLGPIRKKVVTWRLRRLAGRWAVELADLVPPDAHIDTEVVGLTIALFADAPERSGGTLSAALTRPPGDRQIRRVAADLRRLASCSIWPGPAIQRPSSHRLPVGSADGSGTGF